MKHARRLTTGAAAVAVSFILIGCAAKNEVAAPDAVGPTRAPTTVLAQSALTQTAVAKSNVASPPAVMVLDQNGAAMPNVEVSFVVTNGEGSVNPSLVRTDKYGVATASWRLGQTTGEHTLTVGVSGIQPVVFRANSLVPAPALQATRWDLLLIGGQELPLTYSGGGSSWTITGGHYVFLDDSTYTFGYDVGGVEHASTIGRYYRLASGAVQFYLPPGSYPGSSFYAERNGLFSTATVDGNLITVTYEDYIDFEIETYVMSSH